MEEEDDSDGNDANFSEEDLVSDPNDNFHDSSGFQEFEPELETDLRTKSIRRNFGSYHPQQASAAAFASLVNEKSN